VIFQTPKVATPAGAQLPAGANIHRDHHHQRNQRGKFYARGGDAATDAISDTLPKRIVRGGGVQSLDSRRRNFHEWLAAQRGRTDEVGEIARRYPGARTVRAILRSLFLADRHCRADFQTMERVMDEFNAAHSARTPITKPYSVRTHGAPPPELRGAV
jgi:hypothetical protein